MATKLADFDFDVRRVGRPQKYPWQQWTDGSPWSIKRGSDYDVATENMRVNLHSRAAAASMKVRTQRDPDGDGLVFQFYRDE